MKTLLNIISMVLVLGIAIFMVLLITIEIGSLSPIMLIISCIGTLFYIFIFILFNYGYLDWNKLGDDNHE